MIHEQFYSELGKYLYAIAMADGGIQDKELKKLEKTVTGELKGIKNTEDDIQYREVILAKLNFYNCIREHAHVNDARKSFLDFILKYRNKIDSHEKEIALRLIRKVAEAWKGKNKTEEVFVGDAEKYLKG